MIYLLVQDSTGYDDCDGIVFASSSKEVVEQVHHKIVEHHKRYQRVAKEVGEDVEKIHKMMPRPSEPKYGDLPPRPLVWANEKWNNAYVMEYYELVRQHDEKVAVRIEELHKQWADYYQLPIEDIRNIWTHRSDRTFSIDEVEDNPGIDIKTL